MRRPFDGNWILTQGFGENPASYSRFGMNGHNGLDYGTPTGTPILAPHGGTVVETTSDPTGYGLYIKIENSKEGSVLAHLKSYSVKVGDVVKEGQQVAISDNTGNSTGPHLHWGYYTLPRNRSNGYAGFINQAPLLPPRGTTSMFSDSSDIDAVRKERDANWVMYQEALRAQDELRKARDENWNKYLAAQAEVDKLKAQATTTKYTQLKTAVQKTLNEN